MLKNAGAKITAIGQWFSCMFASDETIKRSLPRYTFEHIETASYSVLLAAAHTRDDTQLAETCRTSLAKEEAMAEWLKSEAPDLTREFLKRADSSTTVARRWAEMAKKSLRRIVRDAAGQFV